MVGQGPTAGGREVRGVAAGESTSRTGRGPRLFDTAVWSCESQSGPVLHPRTARDQRVADTAQQAWAGRMDAAAAAHRRRPWARARLTVSGCRGSYRGRCLDATGAARGAARATPSPRTTPGSRAI